MLIVASRQTRTSLMLALLFLVRLSVDCAHNRAECDPNLVLGRDEGRIHVKEVIRLGLLRRLSYKRVNLICNVVFVCAVSFLVSTVLVFDVRQVVHDLPVNRLLTLSFTESFVFEKVTLSVSLIREVSAQVR